MYLQFTKCFLMDAYSGFINHFLLARTAVRVATMSKPGFTRFIEVSFTSLTCTSCSHEHMKHWPKYHFTKLTHNLLQADFNWKLKLWWYELRYWYYMYIQRSAVYVLAIWCLAILQITSKRRKKRMDSNRVLPKENIASVTSSSNWTCIICNIEVSVKSLFC